MIFVRSGGFMNWLGVGHGAVLVPPTIPTAGFQQAVCVGTNTYERPDINFSPLEEY
jgi:hypothetical protein